MPYDPKEETKKRKRIVKIVNGGPQEDTSGPEEHPHRCHPQIQQASFVTVRVCSEGQNMLQTDGHDESMSQTEIWRMP